MTDQTFNLVTLYWVDPRTRVIFYNTASDLPDYAYTTGLWYGLYQSSTQSGLYRLFDVTLQMQAQAGNPVLTAAPINPMIWQQTFTSTPSLVTALSDDVLRSNSWTATHADLTTRQFGVATRVYIDEDFYVTCEDGSFDITNTLFFVNGVFHQAYQDTTDSTSAWIRDGFRTFQQNRDFRQIQAVDFTPLGGVTQVPMTSCTVTPYSDTYGSAYYITYPKGGLLSSTVGVVIEGTMNFVGDGITILSDTVLVLDPSKLDLIEKWYQSPMLRRKAPLVPDANAELTSDVHEADLDLFTTGAVVTKDDITSQAFSLARLNSVHSALLLLPKHTALYQTPLQYETDEKNLTFVNQDTAVENSCLLYKSMIGSPTFLPCHSARARSYLWSPWMVKDVALPQDDPLYVIAIAPEYDRENYYDIRPDMRLVQWVTLTSVIL